MELTAVIEGIAALTKPTTVHLFCDSKYVLDGLESWIVKWKKNGWKTQARTPVKNVDLWQLLDTFRQQHDIHFHWVKGHAGHPENERCDELAVQETQRLQAQS